MRRSPGAADQPADGTAGSGVRCPLCQRGRFDVLFESGSLILLCRGCSLVFLHGSRRDLDDYYGNHYDSGIDDLPTSHDPVVRWVSRHLPATGDRRLLEVGCGHGHLLVRLRALGFRVSGIEPGRRAAEHARDAFGLAVACCTLEGLVGPMRDERYDAVLMIQTLEHLVDPLGALSIVRGLMASDARLVVEVPHYFSPTGLYRARENGRYLPSGNHLFVFSADTLSAFMKRAGFDIIHRARTLADLRIVARPSVRVGAPSALHRRRGAYWKARAFHLATPLLLRGVEAAKAVRQAVRRLRRG